MWDGPGLLRAISVFCELLRQRGIAVVLYETTPARVTLVNAAAPLFRTEAGHRLPAIANIADAAIESFSGDENTFIQYRSLQITDHRTGKARTVESPKG